MSPILIAVLKLKRFHCTLLNFTPWPFDVMQCPGWGCWVILPRMTPTFSTGNLLGHHLPVREMRTGKDKENLV